MQTHTSQEYDNVNNQPPFTEIIEQLVKIIIHSITVWRLSDWDFVIHLYILLMISWSRFCIYTRSWFLSVKIHLQWVILTLRNNACYCPVPLSLIGYYLWNVNSQPVSLSIFGSIDSRWCTKPHRLITQTTQIKLKPK